MLLNINSKRQERKNHNHYIFPAVTSSDNRAGISLNTLSHQAKPIKSVRYTGCNFVGNKESKQFIEIETRYYEFR